MISAFGVQHEISKGVPKGMKRLRLNRMDQGDLTTITARKRKKDLGVLVMHNKPGTPDHGKIAAVEVVENQRRKGLGTAMMQHAERTGITPVHHSIRTKDGDAWMKGVSR